MKKRLLATLLSLLLILSLTPITAFAQAQEVTDINGVTLNYEVTSSPQNGEYYVEGEEVDIIISVTNNSSETISEYSLDNGYIAIYNNLLPGNSSEKLSYSYVVSAEDAEAGTISFDIGCTYKLNGQTDNNTLSKTLTVPPAGGPKSRNPTIRLRWKQASRPLRKRLRFPTAPRWILAARARCSIPSRMIHCSRSS